MPYVQKTKKYRHKIYRFLLKQLCEHVTCQDIYETFLIFFNTFKYVQKYISNKVSAPRNILSPVNHSTLLFDLLVNGLKI
jgi:hypothetical protein